MQTRDQQALIAQCTPSGSGALALLRITGDNAIEVATRISMLPGNKKLSEQATHTIHYGHVVDANNAPIDQVLFLLMHAPRTFTGQNTVEITCHNNPFIIQSIIDRALQHGARLAHAGEFSKRAVLNNKLDLVQAEAIHELITANSQIALKQSLAQLEGSLSSWAHAIEKDLIKALALSEASFEFIDEEDMAFGAPIKGLVEKTLTTISGLKKTFNQQQQIRDGIRIAIIGSVNAGKSSLFNALLDKDRAIVTNIAGTTRDVIEAGMYKNGTYWTLVDTAGLRTTDDEVEAHGIKRSHEQAQRADIVIIVFDGSRTLEDDERYVYEDLLNKYIRKSIVVENKADLPHQPCPLISDTLRVSTTDAQSVRALEHELERRVAQLLQSCDAPFLLNQRQFNLILALEQDLKAVQESLKGDIQYELLSHHLTHALAQLTELTGKSISESGMDAVFREFCVGK